MIKFFRFFQDECKTFERWRIYLNLKARILQKIFRHLKRRHLHQDRNFKELRLKIRNRLKIIIGCQSLSILVHDLNSTRISKPRGRGGWNPFDPTGWPSGDYTSSRPESKVKPARQGSLNFRQVLNSCREFSDTDVLLSWHLSDSYECESNSDTVQSNFIRP